MMLKLNPPQLVRRLPVEWSDRAWTPRVTVCVSARSPIILFPTTQPAAERQRFARLKPSSLRVVAPVRALRRGRRAFGFTLIELLVVISIIGILAALLLPALAAVKKQAAKAKARTEISSIVSAINHYDSIYSRMPISTQATQALGSSPDFTYGTMNGGSSLVNKYGPITPPIQAVDQAGAPLPYQAANSEVMAILMDLTVYPNGAATVNANHAKNPQHTPFLNAKQVSDTTSPGVGIDGVFRDPWGSPYIISMDINGDNKTRDGFYSRAAVSQKSGTIGINGLVQGDPNIQNSFEANTTVMVWSLGPDGKADPNAKANADPNKDNITSW